MLDSEEAFVCPYCNAYAHQIRKHLYYHENTFVDLRNYTITICQKCKDIAIWKKQARIYPFDSDAPLPNEDLPESIKKDYMEAREIANWSPRAAAALLRLVIEKLCDHLGAKGENLNQKIGDLVGRGLPPKLQKAFDTVRVTGNNAIHPGQIDVDNMQTVKSLFDLVNVIANHMITEVKKIDSIFESLPHEVHRQIQERDKKAST